MHRALRTFAPVALALSAGLALAGPLTPPVGPVQSTMKTLVEVEPRIAINAINTPGDNDATPSLFKITQPGSYYLTGNITGVAGKDGIEIASSNVTLDLNGFTLQGVPGSNSGVVVSTNSLQSVWVRNGVAADWGVQGVFGAAFMKGLTLSDLRLLRNAVQGCTIGTRSLMERVSIEGSAQGVSALGDSVIRDCMFLGNGYGATLDVRTTVERCVFSGSTDFGCTVNDGSIVRNCIFANNGGTGLFNYGKAAVEGCTFSGNLDGGYQTAGGARGTIRNNSFFDNKPFAIQVSSYSEITGNHVEGSRAAGGSGIGIWVVTSFAQRTVVRDNAVSDSDTGIKVDGGGNAIYANILTNNSTHLNMAGSNRVGPAAVGPLSAAINGSTGGSGMGSTDPYANIIY